MRIRASSIVLALALGFASVSAQAIPILWTLDSVTFDDNGTATGSFVYDADSNTYSMINVTTMGSALGTVNYMDDHPIFGFDFQAAFLSGLAVDLTGMTILTLSFDPATLTNAGGTLPISLDPSTLSFEGTCINATCVNPTGFPARVVTGGSVIGNPLAVPEPSTLALLGAGLLGLFMRRKRVA